jgi:hypothetical protein
MRLPASLSNEHVSGGRATAQAVSHRPVTAEARVRARDNPRGICGGQSGTGTGLSPSSSVFSCQYHSTVALHNRNISGMNNMSASGSSSETLSHPIIINLSIKGLNGYDLFNIDCSKLRFTYMYVLTHTKLVFCQYS